MRHSSKSVSLSDSDACKIIGRNEAEGVTVLTPRTREASPADIAC